MRWIRGVYSTERGKQDLDCMQVLSFYGNRYYAFDWVFWVLCGLKAVSHIFHNAEAAFSTNEQKYRNIMKQSLIKNCEYSQLHHKYSFNMRFFL